MANHECIIIEDIRDENNLSLRLLPNEDQELNIS